MFKELLKTAQRLAKQDRWVNPGLAQRTSSGTKPASQWTNPALTQRASKPPAVPKLAKQGQPPRPGLVPKVEAYLRKTGQI